MEQRSPVHAIVNALWKALHDLGSPAAPDDVERWGFSIHAALSAAGREFHNHDHVIDIASEGDPLEVLAALYHDAVYIQVDQGPPRSMREEMCRVLEPAEGGWRVLPSNVELVNDVLAVFGRKPGDIVSGTTALNELASALVASIQLASALGRYERIAVAACIEQTIPFRVDPVSELRERLVALAVPDLDTTLKRAVRFGNRDVENFSYNEAARFLDHTWKLLPESNPALHSPTVYTVRDYRTALQKMEGFLSKLKAERVFHVYLDEPKPEIHARRIARTTGNLELATRYLRAKLHAIAVVEAIAEATGGDLPVDYFMGGMKASGIEQHLVHMEAAADVDRALHKLLVEGRASESTFDTKPSPIAAFLHQTIGEAAVMKGFDQAMRWWAGAQDHRAFLASQPAKQVAAIVRGAANIIAIRRDRLFALAERLER